MLERLKNLNAEIPNFEELVELSAFARNMRGEYEHLNAEVPEWLDAQTRVLRREISARQQDSIEKRIKELKARREQLTPAEERRQKIDEELKALEQLAKQ